MSNEAKTTAETFEIVVDDGMRDVPIRNTSGKQIGIFRFRPTDINLVNRYNDLVKDLDTIAEPLENINISADGTGEDDASMAALHEAEQRLFKACDTMFGGNMSEAFFGEMHPFSPVNGVFYCENVLESVGKFIEKQFGQETAKINSRVKRYTGKYAGKGKA